MAKDRKTVVSENIKGILKSLPQLTAKVRELKEILLANLVMVGEIPAPTFCEQKRVGFLMQRFSECGLQNVSSDEVDNAFGIIPGNTAEKNIIVVAHVDTVFPETVDHNVIVNPTRVLGPGVADNSLGVAVLASLPTLLERMDIELEANLILMGGARSLGRGNLEGVRFFLKNNTRPICAGISLEGVQLGRLSFSSIGMIRGDITCDVSEEFDWTKFGVTNPILVLNEVMSRIEEIPLPKRPKTTVVIGSIEGGTAYNIIPAHAELKIEIRSESAGKVKQIREIIDDICAEVATRTGATVHFDAFAGRKQGGLEFNHPLVGYSRRIIKKLGIEPRVSPSTSELAAFINAGIPAVTIGLSTNEQMTEMAETIDIEPMFAGIAQLIALLMAVDRGCANED